MSLEERSCGPLCLGILWRLAFHFKRSAHRAKRSSSEALLEWSAKSARSAPLLAFASEAIHGQPQAGLHASNRLSQ